MDKVIKNRSNNVANWVLDDEGNYRCSSCNAVVEPDFWYWHNLIYCYHCGKKMKVVCGPTCGLYNSLGCPYSGFGADYRGQECDEWRPKDNDT